MVAQLIEKAFFGVTSLLRGAEYQSKIKLKINR
jgi:hypothetical protein